MITARVAAALTWLYAACFGVPAVPVAIYLKQRGTLPWYEDLFPMYGGPWWSRFGHDTFIVALIAFLGLTMIAARTAWGLATGSRRGAVGNLALLPLEAVFWLGFGLPILWFVGAARVVLIALAWRTLGTRRGQPTSRLHA